jgi:uncharacterized protein
MTVKAAKAPAGRIDGLIVKTVERCNLNCSYCYMYQHADQSYLRRPALMSEEVFEHLLARVKEYNDPLNGHQTSLIFHGGEPMLMGVERFRTFAALAQERLGKHLESIQMQSNATMVTDEWISALHEFGVMVGVSLDGPPEIHDMVRVDHSGNGSHARTVEGLLKLQDAGLLSGTLCVVNPAYAGDGIYRYFRSLGIKRMNFLMPDASHDEKEALYGKYGETPVADYLIPVFDDWYREDDPDVSVRLFEDMISTLMGGNVLTDIISNTASNYAVIDTDGTIQANDALKVCDEGVSETGLNVRENGFDDLAEGLPLLHRVLHEGVALCSQCRECPERDTCGGGYLPHRYSRAKGFDNPSIWCQDLLRIFSHVRENVNAAVCA